jgi:hypothetical protein
VSAPLESARLTHGSAMGYRFEARPYRPNLERYVQSFKKACSHSRAANFSDRGKPVVIKHALTYWRTGSARDRKPANTITTAPVNKFHVSNAAPRAAKRRALQSGVP